jgi:hypothetical protein
VFAAGIGTAVLGLGFLILALGLVVARGFAVLERSRLRALTGVEPVAAVYKRPPNGSLLAQVCTVLSDGRRWLDLLYGVLALMPSLLVFPIAVAWWALAVGGVLYPLYDWTLPLGPDNETLPMLIGLGDSGAVRIGLNVTIGVVAALTLPFVMRMLAMLLSSFAALAALAARCPVPVSLDTEHSEAARLSPAVQNAAYFVVAEALTNVAKHSGAGAATVRVSSDERLVRVVVTDDGAGGAHPAKGHGLAGLADRVRALDGHLAVHSPAGGPTVLVAELPGAGSR